MPKEFFQPIEVVECLTHGVFKIEQLRLRTLRIILTEFLERSMMFGDPVEHFPHSLNLPIDWRF
jgi:hypothetical protein